ncbi:hypothetical protein [Rhodopila sp.]|uniref:hypothetical protein n=1 Tax=Rhodopila sp. TaxID=2480087 RepID=UPI003D09DD16
MRARSLTSLLAVCLLTAAATLPAAAQTAPPTRIRGTIESDTANKLTVKARDGQTVDIALTQPLMVLTVKKLDLAAIKPNSYVGIATRTGAGGVMQAIEVLVFPEAGRGSGEGSYPWDLEPGSTMTNGTVEGAVKASTALQLTVDYKGGTKTIQVAPGAPVVTIAPAQRSDLKPGAPVFIGATKSADGALSAGRVIVGTNGVAPPM